MDDLLYTVLVFAWIAYGIYKGIQKNKKAKVERTPISDTKTQSPPSEKASALSAVFSEIFDLPKDEYDEMQHPYQEEEAQKMPEKASNYENHLSEPRLDSYSGTDSVKSVFKEEKDLEMESFEDDEISEYQYEAGDEEESQVVLDLKQAIVHQVILERPY